MVALAKRKTKKYEDLLSLIQVGNIGLIKSIDAFDISNDIKLSTFATPMINWNMNRYLADNNCIKLPGHIQQLVYKINKLLQEYQDKGIKYDYDSLATDLNITKDKLMYILFSPKVNYELNDEIQTEVSSDYKIEEIVEHHIGKELLLEYLDSILSEDEKELMLYRYGFKGKEYSYNDLSKMLNLQVYVLQNKERNALRKLRNIKNSNRNILMDAKYIILK